MPYASEKHAIKDPFLDKRTKLLPCQKEMVIYWSNQGLSMRKIAAMFNCSKRLIQFIINPEAHKKNKQQREDRGGWRQYYNKEDHREAQKAHRKHKDNVYKKKVNTKQ